MLDGTTDAAPRPPSWPLKPNANVAVFSRKIQLARHVGTMLDDPAWRFRPASSEARNIDYVVGWGHKPTATRARSYAREHGLPYVGLEDGFVRSVGLGVNDAPALSIAVDDAGIYYDATCPSRLEQLLTGDAPDSERIEEPALRARAIAAMETIQRHGISKYNDGQRAPALPDNGGRPRVLVVDQTAGDMSLRLGGAPQDGLAPILRAARSEHPDAEIIVKTHPDVVAGKRNSGLGPGVFQAGVQLVGTSCNPIELLAQVDHAYVATSQLGFEALVMGKRVTCFGAPFYAGWGLTDDRVATPRRTRQRDLVDVFVAAYLLYCRYVDPQTGRRGQLEDVLAHLARQRVMFARNARRYYCFGFAGWKHDFVRSYLKSPDGSVHFVRSARQAKRLGFDRDSTLLVWGQRDDEAVRQLVSRAGATLHRMEDGFLRSVQLGSDLTTPASLVVDGRGLYYNPAQPSDLEHALLHHPFGDQERARGASLREAIVERRVSKYAFGESARVASACKPGQPVALVVGQVERDASIRLGCRDVRTNLALLQAARRARPDAFLVFKAHPDVVSGNRRSRSKLAELRAACDELVTTISIADCLDAASEVHTMTSLVGFEALLRGLPVTTYGQPFYAGWGLTEDHHPVARRTRQLTLDELVFGALIHYPRYVHPVTGEFVEAEAIMAYLAAHRGPAALKSWPVRQLGRLKRATRGLFRAL